MPSKMTVAAQEQAHYGGSYGLVKRMYDKGRIRAWTYTPLLGGCLFSLATSVLRRNLKVMLGTQALIGVGTLAMGNAVATTAIVRERSMSS